MRKWIFVLGLVFNFNVNAECDEQGYFDCGDTGDVKWYLSEDKTTLTISGQGNMGSYSSEDNPNYVLNNPKSAAYRTQAPWGKYNDYITTANITEGVVNVGTAAFMGLDKLESVTLPSQSLESIDYAAFDRTYSLEHLDIPDTVTSIGDWAFTRTGLIDLTIPDTVTKLNDNVFINTGDGLQKIVIGDGVQSIGTDSFAGTSAEIYCRESGHVDENGNKQTCAELIGKNNASALSRLKIYEKKGDEYFYNGKFYKNPSDIASGNYDKKRIYTIEEANAVAGDRNTVRIKYR
ncbi:MAG: leucine-rich repeat domain-containing protein [Alphaproteobacteria bacterium]|nr:leucine-rich repeat domain-containing protein [Alphaproteobacteria bacterium]